MHKHYEDEPEDAGLIQSRPPTEQELREISRFIAESKRRNAAPPLAARPPAAGPQHPQAEDRPDPGAAQDTAS